MKSRSRTIHNSHDYWYYVFVIIFAEEACPTYHGKSCVRLWIPLQPTCRQLIKVEGPFSAVHPVVSAFPRTVARPALVNLPTTIPQLPVVTIMPKCQWWIRIIILSMVRLINYILKVYHYLRSCHLCYWKFKNHCNRFFSENSVKLTFYERIDSNT